MDYVKDVGDTTQISPSTVATIVEEIKKPKIWRSEYRLNTCINCGFYLFGCTCGNKEGRYYNGDV